MKDKKAMSFRLSDKAKKLLRLMAEEDGVGMTAFIENSLRAIAKERDIFIKEEQK